jgi:hypothetical protein
MFESAFSEVLEHFVREGQTKGTCHTFASTSIFCSVSEGFASDNVPLLVLNDF